MGEKQAKVVFLDIDGVLCTRRSHLGYGGGDRLMQHLDPVATKMVFEMLHRTGAKLVLSSTWREFHSKMSMTAILQNGGMPYVPWHQNWMTAVAFTGHRGQEVETWLKSSGGDCQYLIIDDNDDFFPDQKPFFVKTDFDDGLLYRHFVQAMEILNKKP